MFEPDPLTEIQRAVSLGVLDAEQKEAAVCLLAFGMSAHRAIEITLLHRPEVIREQARKMMPARRAVGASLVLERLIDRAERQDEQFAKRAAERFFEDMEQRQSDAEFVSWVTSGRVLLKAPHGGIYRATGTIDFNGETQLMIESQEGVSCQVPIAHVRRYEVISYPERGVN